MPLIKIQNKKILKIKLKLLVMLLTGNCICLRTTCSNSMNLYVEGRSTSFVYVVRYIQNTSVPRILVARKKCRQPLGSAAPMLLRGATDINPLSCIENSSHGFFLPESFHLSVCLILKLILNFCFVNIIYYFILWYLI